MTVRGQALRFGLIGTVTALIYFCSFVALLHLAILGLFWNIIIASLLAITFNYLGQYHFSFASARLHSSAFLRYVVLMTSLVLLNAIGTVLLENKWQLDPMTSQYIFLPAIAVLSFIAQRTFVFDAARRC